jgi:hypothetical protein
VKWLHQLRIVPGYLYRYRCRPSFPYTNAHPTTSLYSFINDSLVVHRSARSAAVHNNFAPLFTHVCAEHSIHTVTVIHTNIIQMLTARRYARRLHALQCGHISSLSTLYSYDSKNV